MAMHIKYLIGGAIIVGIIVGISTVYFVSVEFELLLWIALIVLLSYTMVCIIKHSLALYAFGISILIGICITFIHTTFLADYLAHHPQENIELTKWNLGVSIRTKLWLLAPIYWLIFGFSTVVLSLLYRKIKSK